MKNAILRSFAYNLHYANRLLTDIPAERMSEQPFPGMNHPTWIIGHLADTCDLMADWLVEQVVERQRPYRALMLRKALTYLPEEQCARVTGALV